MGFKLASEVVQSLEKPQPRITLVRSGALGDTILLLPLYKRLLQAYPDAEITVIGSAWAEEIQMLMPQPWHFCKFSHPGFLPLFRRNVESRDFPASLKNMDLIFIFTYAVEEVFTANLLEKAPCKVIPWSVTPAPGRHSAVHIAEAIAGEHLDTSVLPLPGLRPPNNVKAEIYHAASFEYGVSETGFVVAHPGSGTRRKCWPPELFAELIRSIIDLGIGCILLEGPQDADICRRVREHLPQNLLIYTYKPHNVADAARLIRRALTYLGNDSGVTHLAAALGTPVTAVFGPTSADVWRPLGPDVETVAAESSEGNITWPSKAEVMQQMRVGAE